VGHDFINGKMIFFPIEYAYFENTETSSAKKESLKFTCENGGFCSGYGIVNNLDLVKAVVDGNFNIAILRSAGTMDVKVPISNFGQASFATEYVKFIGCSERLLSELEKSLPR
jgi:hypothetical protein